jgi:hypothetical protein
VIARRRTETKGYMKTKNSLQTSGLDTLLKKHSELLDQRFANDTHRQLV